MPIFPILRAEPMPTGRKAMLSLLATMQFVAGCMSAPTPPAAAPTPTSATAGTTTIVAISPPAGSSGQTLGKFLGLGKIGGAMGELFRRVSSRARTMLGIEGKFPGLQPKPPLLPITDPSNLGPNSPPAVKAAAEVKKEEDAAAQKIQALRYLAKIGCGGCYPMVEDALLAALDDCTEAVRYEAVLALRGKDGQACNFCKCGDCCSAKVRKKLDEIANRMDGEGCYYEPSERVRRLARMALAACGGYTAEQSPTPLEGPVEAPPETAAALLAPPVTTASPDAAPPAAPASPTAPAPTPAPAAAGSLIPAPIEPIPLQASPIVPRSSAKVMPAEKTPLQAAVHLASFEQPAVDSPADPLMARVNGEPIHESRVLPLVNAEISRLKAAGVTIGPERFQSLLVEQVDRAIEGTLLLQQARQYKSQAAGAAAQDLTPAEVEAWLRRILPDEQHVSLLELNAYYQEHRERFQTAGQVRWEHVSVSTARAGSREQAHALVNSLRSRALAVGGAAPVADIEAADVKVVQWTPTDRIEPAVLRQSLLGLPIGVVSPVIDDGQAFHVVRVLERRGAGTSSVDEAADQICAEIVAGRRRGGERELVERLRGTAQVWTVFDAAVPAGAGGVRPLPPVVQAGGMVLPPLNAGALDQEVLFPPARVVGPSRSSDR